MRGIFENVADWLYEFSENVVVHLDLLVLLVELLAVANQVFYKLIDLKVDQH